MVEALQSLGVQLTWDQGKAEIMVKGCQGQWPAKNVKINAHDAGTVARFLLAACATQPGSYEIDGSARMRERPILPLLNALAEQGIKFIHDPHTFPVAFEVTQSLKGGFIGLNASQSSQFASALMMVAPFARQSVVLRLAKSVSEPYLTMTQMMMRQFGVAIFNHHKAFFISANQRYQSQHYLIEPDASTASYFFALAALTGEKIKIHHLSRQHSLQGDLAFLTILESMGCDVIDEADGIVVSGPEKLNGVQVNMQDCSDTFMTLAALAPFATSPTTIEGIGHTRHQESDRIHAMAGVLTSLKINVEEGNDWLKVYPGTPQPTTVDTYNDHRIAMSLAVIGLKTPGLIIDNQHVVKKTFPAFFDYWATLI